MITALNKSILLFLFLIPGLLLCQTGTIKGKVTDNDGNAILGANIIVIGSYMGAATDVDGRYEIIKASPGKHVLRCSCVGYLSVTDTVEVNNINDVAEKNFFLTAVTDKRIVPDSIINYNDLFSSYKPEEILTLHIDSLGDNCRIIYLTFTNKTMFHVYLSRNFEYINFATVVLKDEAGVPVKSNSGYGCGNIWPELPTSQDFIILKPFESCRFPPIVNYFYDIRDYPKGKYHFSIKYQVENFNFYRPIVIRNDADSFKEYKKRINAIAYLTRGCFYSDNEILIEK